MFSRCGDSRFSAHMHCVKRDQTLPRNPERLRPSLSAYKHHNERRSPSLMCAKERYVRDGSRTLPRLIEVRGFCGTRRCHQGVQSGVPRGILRGVPLDGTGPQALSAQASAQIRGARRTQTRLHAGPTQLLGPGTPIGPVRHGRAVRSPVPDGHSPAAGRPNRTASGVVS